MSKFEQGRPAEGRVTADFAEALRASKNKFTQKSRYHLYYDNPDIWALEKLGFEAWSKQREIGRSVVENAYTAVKSCHGAGKSAWAAALVCWFVDTRLAMGEEVFVITTAPSYTQVHTVLWEQIRKFHSAAKLPGYITGSDVWRLDDGDRVLDLAVGRKPADTDENSFQGKHADNLFIVLDEANGIPETLYTGTTVMLTGSPKRQKMLAIGNPDDPTSQFGKNDAKDRRYVENGETPIWNTIQIKAWECPNFSGEEVSDKVREVTLSKKWVDDAKRRWGMDDPRWTSKIEAEFPDTSEDSLFSLNLIEQAKSNAPDPGYEVSARILGVDISRFGGDKTVMMLNIAGVVTMLDFWSKKNSIETANRIHMAALKHKVTEIRIDYGNTGGAIIDILNARKGYNYRVIEMQASGKSPDASRWLNARAYWYDNLREQMFLNKVQIPSREELEEELSQLRYFFNKHGAIQIEEKDQMKKRLNGRSPDFADALCFAVADLSGLITDEFGHSKPQPGEQAILETMFAGMPGMPWRVSPV